MDRRPRIDTNESFISEPIKPEAGTFDAAAMARGDPGLPAAFVWRGETYRVANVLESWKSTGPDSWGGAERYVRKHWYRIRTTDGSVMKLYFERQARSSRQRKVRWWLHTVDLQGEEEGP